MARAHISLSAFTSPLPMTSACPSASGERLKKDGSFADISDATQLSAMLLNSHLNLPEIADVLSRLLGQFPDPHRNRQGYPSEEYLMAKGNPYTYGSLVRPPKKEDFE